MTTTEQHSHRPPTPRLEQPRSANSALSATVPESSRSAAPRQSRPTTARLHQSAAGIGVLDRAAARQPMVAVAGRDLADLRVAEGGLGAGVVGAGAAAVPLQRPLHVVGQVAGHAVFCRGGPARHCTAPGPGPGH